MILDFSPLRKYRAYRYLYAGQFVSAFGSMVTFVALPYQVYEMTRSSFWVGLIGVVELVPLLFTAFWGGALADSMDRRKLLMLSDAGLFLLTLILCVNALLPAPNIILVFLAAACAAALNGFHRPAHESMTPRLVEKADLPAVSALSSLRGNIATIAGPAVAGLMMSKWGVASAFALDAVSYAVALFLAWKMGPVAAPTNPARPGWKSIQEGLRYAKSRQELLGTYAVDFVAMIFGMPMALFPAMAEPFGGAAVVGFFYSAPAVGALFGTLTSRWMTKVQHQGRGVIVSAFFWGVAITAFGFSKSFGLSLIFLALAGAADMASGIFRMTIWNQTIPDRLRGRLAGIEMLSYMSGPLLGNAEAGMAAAAWGARVSVISGGALCIFGVMGCAIFLPRFWNYDARKFRPIAGD